MSLTARRFSHISAADYLAAENDGTWRHEFVNGAVFAMAGASQRHNLVRGRLAATLPGHVAQGRRVFGAEMKLQKFEAHKRIPSLLEYGLLSQNAMELELFRPRTDWQREFYQRDNTVTFESVGPAVNVSQLYRDIDFEDPALSGT